MRKAMMTTETEDPVIIWWTPFVIKDRIIECNDVFKCFVTSNRDHVHNPKTKFLMFYGSKFDLHNLPDNRDQPWAIFHEESPKNLALFMDKRVQNLFAITSTFSRFSSFPLPLQYLKEVSLLMSKQYHKKTSLKNAMLTELAPVFYLHSDCDTPSGRDIIVKELMKYIKVDSYGPCLNNKKLPAKFHLNGTYNLYEPEFMHFVSRYKFVLAIENAQCFDYITEKLWRPLIAGSVPIYLGSSTVNDWLPNNHSIIHMRDFPDLKDLAKFILKLNQNDKLYDKYLEHKTHNKVTNLNLMRTLSRGVYGYEKYGEEYGVSSFECYVCENAHTDDYKRLNKSKESVYDCEDPHEKSDWHQMWSMGREEADALVNRYIP